MPRKKATRPKPIRVGPVRARAHRPPLEGSDRWAWRAEIADGEGGHRHLWSGRATPDEALTILSDIVREGRHLEQAETQTSTGLVCETVTHLLGLWCGEQFKRSGIAESTKALYRKGYRRLRDTIGKIPLHRLTALDLEHHLGECRAKGDADSVIVQDFKVWKMAAKWGRKHDLVTHDLPAPPKFAPRKRLDGYTPTPDEVAAVLAALPPRRWHYAALRLLWGTGCRRSEVNDLTEAQIDRRASTITVTGKTGTRTIPVLPEVLALVPRGATPDARLWPVTPETFRSVLWTTIDRACRRAGVRHFSPHAFRRAAVDQLARAGVDVKTAAEMLGHSPAVMWEKYRQVTDDDKREALQRARLGALPTDEDEKVIAFRGRTREEQ